MSMLDTMLKAVPPERLAQLVVQHLPPLPNDGTPHTETRTRGAFRTILASADFPLLVRKPAAKYLEDASDAQLVMVANIVHAMSRALPSVDDRIRESGIEPSSAPLVLVK